MKIINRRARYDYDIIETFEAGIVLTGPEVKSLRGGHGSLEGAYVKLVGDEAFLINARISPYAYARQDDYDPKKTRKLLLHRKEITSLVNKMDTKNLTLIPVSWYTIGPRIKLEVGLARGKKQYEKREAKKKADMKRELEEDFRGKVR